MNSMFFSLLNLKAAYDSRFTVLEDHGPFELRFYQRMVCAKVSLSGSYEEVLKDGTQYLLDYIQGNNFKVVHIKNHGHLFHVHKENTWDVGLVLPHDVSPLSVPKPINRLVKIEEWMPAKVAALKFKGSLNPKLIERRAEDLNKWLRFKKMNASGPLRVAHHDSIFPFSFLQTNEVQMDVELS